MRCQRCVSGDEYRVHRLTTTSLRFLTRFGCQEDADWLTPSWLCTWLRGVGYTGRKDPAVLRAHLATAPRGTTDESGAAAAAITSSFVTALTGIVAQIHALDARIAAPVARFYHHSKLTNLLARLNRHIVRWAGNKYKGVSHSTSRTVL